MKTEHDNMRSIQMIKRIRQAQGFTLIEVMIVVAILAILAAIAYPSYTEYVWRAQRAEMQRVLMEATQYMQRYYSAQDTYTDAQLPPPLTRSPTSGTAHYNIELVEGAAAVIKATRANRYSVRASRTGPMANDRCGDLSIDQSGVRSIANQTSGLTLTDCFTGP